MARPTKYKDSFVKVAEDYLDECRSGKKVPFLEELAARLDVTEKTILNWSKAREEFFLAIEKIMDHQRMALKTLGLKSPHVITFLLEANHGMMRTERIQHTGPKEEPLTLIFTDSATFKKHEENKARLEALNNKEPEVAGKYDWSDYANNH
jgi:hypothetical protein